MRSGVRPAAIALLLLLALWAAPPSRAGEAPALGRPLPPFSLPDPDGKPHSSKQLTGRVTVLCFFCGCDACRACATTWGGMLRGGVFRPADAASARPDDVRRPAEGGKRRAGNPPPRPASNEPATVIVYMGDAAAARQFIEATGLDPASITALADPDCRVTQEYGALPCPRIYVTDRDGRLRYLNNHADDAPQQAAPEAILAHVVSAVRRCAGEPPRPKKGVRRQ